MSDQSLPITQFAVRSNENTQVFSGPPEFKSIKSFTSQDIIVSQIDEENGTQAKFDTVSAAVAITDNASVADSASVVSIDTDTSVSSQKKLNVSSPAFVPASQISNKSEVKSFLYDNQGKYLGWILTDTVKIFNSANDELVLEIKEEKVLDISFSSKGSYVATYVRYNTAIKEANDQSHCNLKVWEISSGECVLAYTCKHQGGWAPNWTEDEAWLARMSTNQIVFHRSSDFSTVACVLKQENIGSFSLSPGKRPVVAVFVPEKKGQPGWVRLYDINSFKQPLAQKSFYRADTVNFHWNNLGTNVLVFTHTDMDSTGKSYYGETNLYYLSISGTFDCRVDLSKAGPIHDVAWSPNSMEFIVIYGTMPAKATLFNNKAQPIYEFGISARNSVKYSPVGRLILIAGFGNLTGDLDIWDRQTCKKIASINCANASSCEWSPDGKYFMTSILYKRLKVDNGIKIYHYTGSLIYKHDCKELYQSSWRPASSGTYPPIRSLSPAPKSLVSEADAKQTKSTGVYIPPSARGRAGSERTKPRVLSELGYSVSSVLGSGSESLRNSAIPGLNKSNSSSAKFVPGGKKPGAKRTIPGYTGDKSTGKPVQSSPFGTTESDSASEIYKQIRKITKKLERIESIKEKIKNGESVEITQQQMVSTDNVKKLNNQLQELQAKIGSN